MPNEPGVIVYILDDDEAVRRGFARLLRSAGLDARAYDSAKAFFDEVVESPRACLLLDITMPRMTGPQVQQELVGRGLTMPVITISAKDDDDARTWARELGARMFLRKPVDDQALLDAISWLTEPQPAR
jgi:FixJ family two-component response regulator